MGPRTAHSGISPACDRHQRDTVLRARRPNVGSGRVAQLTGLPRAIPELACRLAALGWSYDHVGRPVSLRNFGPRVTVSVIASHALNS